MSINPVLIVGAGPTGLMMACELARYGIPFRIIDKKPFATTTSNAAGIQTRTLEIFSDIGIIKPFLELGVQCRGMQFNFQGQDIFSLSVSDINSIYKFILMLPQCDTEAILEAHLNSFGFSVERNKQFNSLIDHGAHVEAVLKDESIPCSWIIGCDGARSKVRENVGISFPGDDIEDRFVVADVHLSGVNHSNVVNVYSNVGSILAIFPLGKDRYRLAANLHDDLSPRELIEEDVKALVEERTSGGVEILSASWVSPFWIHSKLATKMREGRVFLAGDAAHIHSPVGGQGMNTGLQDVYNLAWKLAYVIQGKDEVSLLDSYELERRPIIQEVVTNSERATKVMISENRVIVWLRNQVFKFINSQVWLKKKMAMKLTQLSICYSNSPINDYSESAPKGSPAVGERAPDVELSDGKRLHDYFDHKKFNALVFTGREGRVDLNAIKQEIKSRVRNLGNIVVIDCDRKILDCYQVKKPIIYVIRPDGYISAVKQSRD